MVGDGAYTYSTTDGGSNWSPVTIQAVSSKNLNDIIFVDANTGWIVGASGTILSTNDGGSNWSSQTS